LTWPLIGRSEELGFIESALSAPEISGVVISGAAGVGKSRVAREALGLFAAKGRGVRWAIASSAARTLPLGAFASWAPSTETDSRRLVSGVIDALTTTSDGTTPVVCVDDAHLLDDLSTFVLHQLVTRRAAKVMVTIRDGEDIPIGLRDVLKAGQVDRLVVQPLSRDETAQLLSSTLGGPVDPDAARRLWALTRGNALYLRNIVEQEASDGRLAVHDGRWHWTGDPIMPPGLVELIEARIGDVPNSVGEVIDTLAVGEPIELESLIRITDAVAVEEADERGLVTLETSGGGAVEVHVSHPLYSEVRRRRASPVRLRRLRGRVASELAASDRRDDLRVVVHRAVLSIDSDLKPDADLLTKAAQGAVWLLDLPLARRLADAAIRAGGDAEASFICAYVLSWLGDGEQADAVLAKVPTEELTAVDVSRFVYLRAMNRLITLADPEGAKRLIDDASREAKPGERSGVDAFLALYWAATGKPDAARESAEEFARAEQQDAFVARHTAWALTVAAGDAGRTDDAVASAEASYPVPIRTVLTIPEAHAVALVLSGRITDAEKPAEYLRQRSVDVPEVMVSGRADAVIGLVALGAGRLEVASSLLESVVVRARASGDKSGNAARSQVRYATALAMRGLTGEAAAALDAVRQYRHPAWRYLDYEHAIAKAWVSAGQGAVSEAVTMLLTAAETARANGQFAPEVMCLQTAVQFGESSCGPRLRELKAIVEGPRAAIAAHYAEALRAADGDELALVSEDFERMGDLVAATDAAADACTVYRRKDLRGSALASSVRAQALAERCGGARTPALGPAVERLPLTDREREIVMLIRNGLTNRDVAQRLSLSVRTVENHIYRAMAKTGTTSRDQLAGLMPGAPNAVPPS